MTRTGIFITTYRRAERLAEMLAEVFAQTRPPDLALVIDNAADSATEEIADRPWPKPVLYHAMEENVGASGGWAYGLRRLVDEGCDLLLFGEDDNAPLTPDTYERLHAVLARHGGDVGCAAPVGSRWNWKTGRLVRPLDSELSGDLDVDFVGGGQSMLVRRQVVDEIGVPDAGLFFGYPDLDYCLRIRLGGFRIVVDGELMHAWRERCDRLGIAVQRTPVPRRPLAAAWRQYYTTRNYIYLMRERFARPDLARREAVRTIARAGASLLRGPRYALAATVFLLRGLRDGYRGVQGRTVVPGARYFD